MDSNFSNGQIEGCVRQIVVRHERTLPSFYLVDFGVLRDGSFVPVDSAQFFDGILPLNTELFVQLPAGDGFQSLLLPVSSFDVFVRTVLNYCTCRMYGPMLVFTLNNDDYVSSEKK